MIEIDGSYGEGGGQILRSALSLSCLTGKPFRIVNIRKGRKKPGLMPQHLVSVRAAKAISAADVSGDRVGSVDLVFSPGPVLGGDLSLDVGTAGSTLLVLQTVLPALAFAGTRTVVTVRGGTHVPFSPTYHYAAFVLLPMLSRIGVRVSLDIRSYGFYPTGGGEVIAEITPVEEIRPVRLPERGKALCVKGWSGAGNLPMSIAVRQRDAALDAIRRRFAGDPFPVGIELLSAPTPGQGTFLFLCVETENAVAGFASLGERGKRAEDVGKEAVSDLADYLETGAALDPHLPDQLALYLALCREESFFTTSRLTHHLATNLWTIGRFRALAYSIEGETGGPGSVRIGHRAPRGDP